MKLPNITKFDFDVNFDTPFKQKLDEIRQEILNYVETVSSSTQNIEMSAIDANDLELVLLDHYSNRIARYLVSTFIKNNKMGISDPDKFVWPYEVVEIDPETKEKIKEEIGPKQKEIDGNLVDTDKIFNVWNPDSPHTETESAKRETINWINNMVNKMQSAKKSIESAFAIFDSRFVYKEQNVPTEISDLKSITNEINKLIQNNSTFLTDRLKHLNDKTNKYATGFTREEYLNFSKNTEELISRTKEFLSRIVNGISALRSTQKTTSHIAQVDTDSKRIKESLNNSIMDLNTLNKSVQTQMVKGHLSNTSSGEENIGKDVGYVDIPSSVLDDIRKAVNKKIFRSPLVYDSSKPKKSTNEQKEERIQRLLARIEKRIQEYINDMEEKLNITNAGIDDLVAALRTEYKTGRKIEKKNDDFLTDDELMTFLGKIQYLATKKINADLQSLRMSVSGKYTAEQIQKAVLETNASNAKIDAEIKKLEDEYDTKVSELEKKRIVVPPVLARIKKMILDIYKAHEENKPSENQTAKLEEYQDKRTNPDFRMAELVKKILNLNSKTLHVKKDTAEELLNFCVMNGVQFTTIDPSMIHYDKVGEEETAIDKTDRLVLSGATINGHLADMYTDTKKNIERFVNYKIDDMIEKMDYV